MSEGEPYCSPLVALAREDLKGIDEELGLSQEERLKRIVARVRKWIERTAFRFDKDTVRVPYRKIP